MSLYTSRALHSAELNQTHRDERLGRYVGFVPEETPTGLKCPECGSRFYTENYAVSRQTSMFSEPAQEYWLTCEDCGANFDERELAIPQRKPMRSETSEDELEQIRRIA